MVTLRTVPKVGMSEESGGDTDDYTKAGRACW